MEISIKQKRIVEESASMEIDIDDIIEAGFDPEDEYDVEQYVRSEIDTRFLGYSEDDSYVVNDEPDVTVTRWT